MVSAALMLLQELCVCELGPGSVIPCDAAATLLASTEPFIVVHVVKCLNFPLGLRQDEAKSGRQEWQLSLSAGISG